MKSIREELENDHPNISETLMDDFEKMSKILTNEDCVNRQLSKLENLLKKRVDEGDYDIGEDRHYKKLLSNVFYEWGLENDFNKMWVKIKRLVSREEFQEFLSKKMLLKDTGAVPNHGEWTHVLQWYIVAEALKESNFKLNNTLADIYVALGDVALNRKGIIVEETIWGKLFDRFPENVSDNSDFRCPEKLLEYIRNKAAYPLLSHELNARFHKRTRDKNNYNKVPFTDIFSAIAYFDSTCFDSDSKIKRVTEEKDIRKFIRSIDKDPNKKAEAAEKIKGRIQQISNLQGLHYLTIQLKSQCYSLLDKEEHSHTDTWREIVENIKLKADEIAKKDPSLADEKLMNAISYELDVKEVSAIITEKNEVSEKSFKK